MVDVTLKKKIRTKSGAYKTLNEAIIVDIPEESVVEPFKYIYISNEVASDILVSNKELLRLVAKDCSNHQSISSKQEWAEEKIKEYTIAYEAVDDLNVKRLIDNRITQFEVELGFYKRLLNKGEC